MPELPEVETVVRGLGPQLAGRTLSDAQVLWGRTVEPMLPDDFVARLDGQQIESLGRRAKYIVLNLTHDVLLVHLRMTGRLYIAGPGTVHDADRWLRVTAKLDDGEELRFSDSRKFGRLRLVADIDEVTGKLGPEPLSDAFTREVFAGRLDRRSGTIKPLLLNQEFVAGIGNIYADEALWLSRIGPLRAADTLTDVEITALHAAIREVLQRGIDHEGASINWYRKPDGSKGNSQDHFNAYGKNDQPCPRCGTTIEKIRIGQRGTHYCPLCQK